jgi:hypothetical protein
MEPFAVIFSSRKTPGTPPTPDYILRITPDSFVATGRRGSLMVTQAEAANAAFAAKDPKEWKEEFKELSLKYKEIYPGSGYGANTDVVAYTGKDKQRVDNLVAELETAEEPTAAPRGRRTRVGSNRRKR